MNSIEENLKGKIRKSFQTLKWQRERRIKFCDIFDREDVILPSDLRADEFYDRVPIAAFNPGAGEIKNGKVDIYPRINFDCIYNQSPSVIGKFQYDLERNPHHYILDIEIYPDRRSELRGCEDPRIYEDDAIFNVLYTGWGVNVDNDPKAYLMLYGNGKKDFFVISSKNGFYLPDSNKDAAILNFKKSEIRMLARSCLSGGEQVCWSCTGTLEPTEMLEETFEVQLVPNIHEKGVGWSTNAIKLSKSEYLIGWHSIRKSNLMYANGLAIVDEFGNLKGISDYLLYPQGKKEWIGNHYGVIFGCGLRQWKDRLYWFGGISDWAIGIFSVDMDKALSSIKGYTR